MPKRHIVPFWMLPSSWGLTGSTREIAKAEYELDGEELERKLIEVNPLLSELEKTSRHLDLDLKYHKIDTFEYDHKMVDLKKLSPEQAEIEHYKIDVKYGKKSNEELDRKTADFLKKPWASIKSVYNDTQKENGMILEIEWNDFFIDMLRQAGYSGLTDEEIFNQYLNDLYREQLPDPEEPEEPMPYTRSTKREDGRTEYE